MSVPDPDKFQRWKLGWNRTWAYRLFQRHHHQINTFYWAHAGALRHAFGATRGLSRSDRADAVFKLPDPENYNLNIDLSTWAERYGGFDNWVRLNALVAITGYLEVYLKTVIRLALESDPGQMHGSSRAVDGVVFANPKYSFKSVADEVVIGDWNQRIARYERYFGGSPESLRSSVEALEELRKTRNGVTHVFGRATDDYDSLLDMDAKPLKKISEKKLIKTLGLVDKIARSADIHLGERHVGDYEPLYFYHVWDKAYDPRYQTEAKQLSKKIGELHGRGQNNRYYKELINHYHSL